jgi:hypothetical protein
LTAAIASACSQRRLPSSVSRFWRLSLRSAATRCALFCARVRLRLGIIVVRSVLCRCAVAGAASAPVGAHREGNSSALPGVVT